MTVYLSKLAKPEPCVTELTAVTLWLLPYSTSVIRPCTPSKSSQQFDQWVTHPTWAGDRGFLDYLCLRPNYKTCITAGQLLQFRAAILNCREKQVIYLLLAYTWILEKVWEQGSGDLWHSNNPGQFISFKILGICFHHRYIW